MRSNSNKISKLKSKYSKKLGDGGFAGFKTFVLTLLPASLLFILLKRFLGLSEYKLKRESIKFFQLSSIAYSARQINRSSRLSSTALRMLGSSLPNSYIVLMRSCIQITAKEPGRRNGSSELILEATVALPAKIFDATGWYQLSRGLFSLGYFRAAWEAREKSLDLSILEGSEQISFSTPVKRAIEAHLERRDFNAVTDLLDRFSGVMELHSLNDTLAYLAMMQGSYVISISNRSSAPSIEKLFRELISRQTALVGAGSPSENLGDEIDSSQTVVRLKYLGQKYLPSENRHGSRCDISAYNMLSNLALLRQSGDTVDFIDDLRIVIGRINESKKCPDLQKIGEIPILWVNRGLPVYRSTAVSGIRVLYLLLRFGSTHLKLYGYDFYSLPTMYDDSRLRFYREGHGWKLGDPFQPGSLSNVRDLVPGGSFSIHDPVSNFCFAQNLYKAGLFDIEPYGKSILELTPYQYVERLEEMLGDW